MDLMRNRTTCANDNDVRIIDDSLRHPQWASQFNKQNGKYNEDVIIKKHGVIAVAGRADGREEHTSRTYVMLKSRDVVEPCVCQNEGKNGLVSDK